ncbi:MAG: GNAT family N-acetyltransferase [Planctomycetes bacterium]|nr:GNAT family N-acetyltransferase [Planctomycetota bacterium]
MSERPEIRSYQSGDEASIVEGWNAVFPAQDGVPSRDVPYWRWLFEDNPVGRPEITVAIVDDRVVGQYACVPMRAVDESKPDRRASIGLIVDAFVLPQYRRALGRPGLVIHLAQRLHDLYCGPRAEDGMHGDHGHDLLYGYPFPIWRIAQRYLASEMVRDMDILFREVGVTGLVSIQPAADIRVDVVTDASGMRAAGDAAWALCEAEQRFGLVRDGEWFAWRYAAHPQNDYEMYVARDAASRAVRGVAVRRTGTYAVHGSICVDWVVPVGDEDAERTLLAALDARTRDLGLPVLLAHFPQPDPRFLRWQRQGFLVGPPSHFLVMNTFVPHVRWLRDRWYHTLGDSDLV